MKPQEKEYKGLKKVVYSRSQPVLRLYRTGAVFVINEGRAEWRGGVCKRLNIDGASKIVLFTRQFVLFNYIIVHIVFHIS